MAFTVQVYPQHRFAHVRLTGSVDGAQLVGATHAVVGHPAWDPSFASVCDASGLAELCLAPDDVHRLVETKRTYRAAGRAAGAHVIVARRDLDAAIARLVVRKGEMAGTSSVVVRSFEAALEALGIVPSRDLAA